MSSPDVRVRLTPEGVKDVLDAFRKTQDEAKKTAAAGAGNLKVLSGALREIKSLLPALGAGAAIAGITGFAKASLNAANQVGKVGEKVGDTSENISTLLTVFKGSDQNLGDVQLTLTNLAQSLGDLNAGTDKQVDAFAKLNLSSKDFEGKSIVESFTLIAERMSKLEGSTQKTDLAFDIFKKQAAEVIPVLNELGEKGFKNVEEAAARTGQVISTDLANAAKAADDSLNAIKGQAQGLANQFVTGLAPSIIDVMGRFQSEIDGKGLASVKEFGKETGRIIRVVIETFQTLFTVVRDVFNGLANQIGGFSALFASVFRGDFAEAASIWKNLGEQGDADFQKLKADFKAGLADIVKEANTDVPEIKIPIKPEIDPAAAKAAAEQLAKINREIAGREAAKKNKVQADKDATALAAAQKKALQETAEIETKLLELRGQSRESQIRALDEEIRKYKETFTAAKQLTSDVLASLDELRTRTVAKIDFGESVKDLQRQLDNLQAQRDRITDDVELGITSQRTGQERLLAIEKERLAVLQQMAAAALAAAQATGDPEAIARAEELNSQVRQVEISVFHLSDKFAQLKESVREGISGDLEQFFGSTIREVDNLRDAFKSLGDAIIDTFARISAEIITKNLTEKLFGSMGTTGASSGGSTGGGWLGAAASFIAGFFHKGGRLGGLKGYARGGQIAPVYATGTAQQAAAIQTFRAGGRLRGYARGGSVLGPEREDGLTGLAMAAARPGSVPGSTRTYAEGGAIAGSAEPQSTQNLRAAGSSVADVVFWGSRDEFVVNKIAATKPGMMPLLQRLNSQGLPAAVHERLQGLPRRLGSGTIDASSGQGDATPGGLLRGLGTKTSDSLLLWGSKGEYVVRADAVHRPGVLPLLQRINNQGLSAHEITAAMRSNITAIAPAYASGGMVGGEGWSPPASGGRGGIYQDIRVQADRGGNVTRQTLLQVAKAASDGAAAGAARNG